MLNVTIALGIAAAYLFVTLGISMAVGAFFRYCNA